MRLWWLVTSSTRWVVVSRGASRVQETLADRWAIRAYGSEAFVAAHRHIAVRSVEMPLDLDQTIKDGVENQWSLPSFYQYAVERTSA